MEIKIIKEEYNPLLKRKEVWFEVKHEKKPTPPKIKVAETLAAKLNTKLDLMVIRHYTTGFGTNVSRGLCLIYDDEKSMVGVEPQKKVNPKKRIGMKEKEESKEGEGSGETQTQ